MTDRDGQPGKIVRHDHKNPGTARSRGLWKSITEFTRIFQSIADFFFIPR
jgi:hypothetical protein